MEIIRIRGQCFQSFINVAMNASSDDDNKPEEAAFYQLSSEQTIH